MAKKYGSLSDVTEMYAEGIEKGELHLSKVGEDVKEDLTDDWEAALVDSVEEDELLTIEEAAALLGVTKQTLRNWEDKGKLVPTRTVGNHRRYTRSQINTMRGKQMQTDDILLHGIQNSKLRDMVDRLLGSFEPDEILNVTLKKDHIEKKVILLVETADGLSAISKTFKMED